MVNNNLFNNTYVKQYTYNYIFPCHILTVSSIKQKCTSHYALKCAQRIFNMLEHKLFDVRDTESEFMTVARQ